MPFLRARRDDAGGPVLSEVTERVIHTFSGSPSCLLLLVYPLQWYQIFFISKFPHTFLYIFRDTDPNPAC